jgi:hypothetical protein
VWGRGVNRLGCWGVGVGWVGGGEGHGGTRLLYVCVYVSSIIYTHVYIYPLFCFYICIIYIEGEGDHTVYAQPWHFFVVY